MAELLTGKRLAGRQLSKLLAKWLGWEMLGAEARALLLRPANGCVEKDEEAGRATLPVAEGALAAGPRLGRQLAKRWLSVLMVREDWVTTLCDWLELR